MKDFILGLIFIDIGLFENLDKDYDLFKIFKLFLKESKLVEKGKGEVFYDEGESSIEIK